MGALEAKKMTKRIEVASAQAPVLATSDIRSQNCQLDLLPPSYFSLSCNTQP